MSDDEASCRSRRPVHREPVDSLPPAVYAGRVPLAGRNVVLEPLDPRRHASELFAISRGNAETPSIWEFLPYGPFNDVPPMREWLRQCAGASDPAFFAVRDRKSDGLAGMASFLNIRPNSGSIEIGHIWFSPAYQNTLQATEALWLMMRHAMDELEYRRLEWKCNAANSDSRSAALRLGFRFEGVFFNHQIVKGRNRDTAWYSIIDSEWPAVAENFRRWLDPDNFDENGRQLSSLGSMNRALW